MKEITVIAKDRIGLLADISEALGKSNINIESVSVETSNRTAIIRLVINEFEKAKRILNRASFKVMDEDILVVRISDRPGELARLSRALAQERINIANAYLLSKAGNETLLALKINSYEKAKNALKKYL